MSEYQLTNDELIGLCKHYASKLEFNKDTNKSVYEQAIDEFKSVGITLRHDKSLNTNLQTIISKNGKARLLVRKLDVPDELREYLLNKLKEDTGIKKDYKLPSVQITINRFV